MFLNNFYFITQPKHPLSCKICDVCLSSFRFIFCLHNSFYSLCCKKYNFSILLSPHALLQSNDQLSLETIKSVDDLLQFLYPEYSVIQQCLKKRSWHSSSSPSSSSLSTSSMSPLLNANNQDMWVPMREEALYKVDDTWRGKH